MNNAPENLPVPLWRALAAAGVIGALILGAALAGWLDHGAEIFLSMASGAWAYCF
jgi:hypothetical protein